jgi:hypothetical protein
VANPNNYSPEEVNEAATGIENIGSGGVDVSAGIIGGIAGGYVGSAIRSSLVAGAKTAPPAPEAEKAPLANDAESSPVADGTAHHAHTQHGTIAGTTSQVDDPTKGALVSGDPSQSGLHSHTVGVVASNNPGSGTENAPADAAPVVSVDPTGADQPSATSRVSVTEKSVGSVPTETTQASIADKPASSVATTAEAVNVDLEQSIAANQNLLRAATDKDSVVSATKQAYDVMFEKITEPGTVPTLENPSGALLQPGEWLATRLGPDGNPVVENGIINRWPVTDKTILKTYQTTPEELNGALKLILGTRTDAPPVHMVQLREPLDIVTSWGKMHGDVGAWLANYDYNPATGEPGTNFAIVSSISFKQTYQVVPKPTV